MMFGSPYQISRLLRNQLSKSKNIPLLTSSRNYSSKSKEKEETPPAKTCPNVTCRRKDEKKGWMSSLKTYFIRSKPKTKPPIETCRIKLAECKPDPDLSGFGGKPFKTCGSAYIIQKDVLPSKPVEISKEDKILHRIEANLGNKKTANDPMPHFTSVEQRMMDLNEKRLHPLYKRYQNVPKRRFRAMPEQQFYQSRSGPINPYEIPVQLNINRELLEKKNMFAEYKRIDPPQQLLGKLVEMKKNERHTMKKRMPIVPSDAQTNTKRAVFDTLYQKEIKF